jgi:glycosyltransferase involved in cell wall biosynthesis
MKENASPPKSVCGVIMTRNEEGNIADIIRSTKPVVDDVYIVDGHSTDRTREIAEAEGAKIILDNGKGKGDGIRTAIKKIDFDILVFIDADGSHDPQDIPKMVAPIKEGRADMVVGSRGRGGSDELHGDIQKLLRMIGSDIILIAINYRWKTHLTDSQNGFRAVRTQAARTLDLKENITTIEQEMTMKFLKKGYTIDEIPAHEYSRKHGNSSIKLSKVWFRYIWSTIKYLF